MSETKEATIIKISPLLYFKMYSNVILWKNRAGKLFLKGCTGKTKQKTSKKLQKTKKIEKR